MPDPDEQAIQDTESDWIAFSSLDQMKSHWDRPGWWPGRRGYYWYLTFKDEAQLGKTAAYCQARIASPHFDLVSLSDLHMTLERIAFDDEIDEAELDRIAAVANEACRHIVPFTLRVGPLAGSSGAISFSTSPSAPIIQLRKALIGATVAVLGKSSPPESPHFRPHVGIAYCNRSISAYPIIKTVGSIREAPPVEVQVQAAALVSLTRKERSYRWITRNVIPLGTIR